MGEVNRREQADDQTDDQRHRKPLDLLRSNPIEDQSGDKSCQVGVENRCPSPIESVANRKSWSRFLFPFFSYPFEDENVCVDAHTDREDEPRDTGKGQRLPNKNHNRDYHRQVEEERDRRDHATKAVVENNQSNRHHEGENTGVGPLRDRNLPHARPDHVLAHRLSRKNSWEGPGVEDVDQSLHVSLGEASLDDPAVADRRVQVGSRQDIAVEKNRHAAFEVSVGIRKIGAGKLQHLARSAGRHRKGDL